MDIFWDNQQILLTGGCGFLGKLLIEKILRCLPQIGTLFLLIREKKLPPQQRLQTILESPLLAPLKQQKGPEFYEWALSKLVVISGDLRQPDLGLSDTDRNRLADIQIIIHAAAVGDFNAPLDLAVQTNGTDGLFRLSKRMPNLRAFLFVSTAYIHGTNASRTRTNSYICDEAIKPLRIDPYKVVNTILRTGGAQTMLTEKEVKQYPNTHCFTKHLAENILAHNAGNVPLIIVRPSHIGSTYVSPFPGWTESLSPVGSLFMYTGLGLTKFISGDPNTILDLVPADYVVNHILFTISQVASPIKTPLSGPVAPPHIFHIASSATNPLRWGYATQTMLAYWKRNPPRKATSDASLIMFPLRPVYKQQTLMKYDLPVHVYSAISSLTRSEFHVKQANKMKALVNKAHKLNEGLLSFLENEWMFSTKNSEAFVEAEPTTSLKSVNKETRNNRNGFNFDWRTIDWHDYINFYCYGIQRFSLRENIPEPKEWDLSLSQMIGRDVLSSQSDSIMFPDARFSLFSSYNVQSPNSNFAEQTQIRDAVLTSPKLKEVIGVLSQSDSEDPNLRVAALEKEAQEILQTMMAKMNVPTLRIVAYGFRKIWQQLYRQINVNQQGLEVVKHLLDQGAPIVYMPSHRSYIDFLILSYLLFAHHLPLPHIAAGEDFLGIAVVHKILRAGGAFFLRRSFRGDLLYSTIFTLYVQHLLFAGVPLEFFIEGTRSRTGKSLKPKLGLLGMITESYFTKKLTDINFIPVHINYERLVEANLYPNEMLGKPKRRESLTALIEARTVLYEDYGRISIKIGDPISLKEYTHQLPTQLKNKEFDPFSSLEDRKTLNVMLGNKIIHEITEQSVWSAISLVASILLAYRFGISRNELIEMTQWLQEAIIAKKQGHFDWLIEQNPTALVDKGLEMLTHVVILRRDSMIQCDSELESCHVLALYRNKLLHLFFREAALVVAFAALAKNGAAAVAHIIPIATFAHELLDLEVIYKEDPDTPENFHETIQKLIQQSIFSLAEVDGQETLLYRKESAAKFEYYGHLLWPFIESYWISSLVLLNTKPNGTPLPALIERCLWLAKNLVSQGKCYSGESCSKDTLSNAVLFFSNCGVIRSTKSLLYLTKDNKDNNRLMHLAHRINQLRKGSNDEDLTIALSQMPKLSPL